VRATGFFKDSLGNTYQECYADREENLCLTAAPNDVNQPITLGPIAANATQTPPTRSTAIVTGDKFEGAYLFYIDTTPTVLWPYTTAPIYCVGRGTIDGANDCVIDTCGRTTTNYATSDGPGAPGEFCYHTCFRQQA